MNAAVVLTTYKACTHLVRLAHDLEALFGLLGVISVLVRVPLERLF